MKPLHSLLSKKLAAGILLATSQFASADNTLSFASAPPSNLDISQLGQLAILGDFSGASLYQYAQQTEAAPATNGSQSLLSRFPDGSFATLLGSDATILSMCALSQNGTFVGVAVGGNFTSLGGVNSPAVAMFLPDTQTVRAMPGLNGKVNALLCGSDGTLYVGGQFAAGNASNAIAWTNSTGFKALPFVGFNGAVNAIIQESNGDIVFAGAFDGLGDSTTPEVMNSQEIPLPIGNWAVAQQSTLTGFSDPKNIICKGDATDDGPGNALLFADGATGGTLEVTMPFGFIPSLLRLRNTNYQGRGTKAFKFTAFPIDGTMNLTYTDGDGNQQWCTDDGFSCPMPQGNGSYTEYTFVNSVGMDGFSITFEEYYGAGAGLAGLDLFQSDIYTFAVNEFNEPQCPGVNYPAKSVGTGNWAQITGTPMASPSYQKAVLQGAPVNTDAATMTFYPDIRQSGNYSVTLFTPGCIYDNSCPDRGQVAISGNLAAGGPTLNATLFQTNNYDKYDQIFLGHVDANAPDFTPSIVLQAAPGQKGPLAIVAQRVRFELVTTSGGLNGIFEWNPSNTTVDMNFKKSSVDSAATALDADAQINALAYVNGDIYAGGAFTGGNVKNFLPIGANATNQAAYGGLNGAVLALYSNGSTIYVGGSFTGTQEQGGPAGLNGVAAYDAGSNSWAALGGGVKGSVGYIVPFQLALTSDASNTVLALALSGTFSQILPAKSGAAATTAANFAVWIPSKNDWLDNLAGDIPTISLQGVLTTGTDVPNGNPSMFGGAVSSSDVDASGAVEITGDGATSLEAFPVSGLTLGHAAAGAQKRATAPAAALPTAGINAGTFYSQGSNNWTVLAGEFSATDSAGNAVSNLVIIDGSNKVSGLQPASLPGGWQISSVAVSSNLLFVGGNMAGTAPGTNNAVSGLVVWDLANAKFAAAQPAALGTGTATVNAVSAQPSSGSTLVFVGGAFTQAGSLPCAALCIYDSARAQWTAPTADAAALAGTVTMLSWVDGTHVLVAGDLTVNGTAAVAALYDVQGKYFTYGAPAAGGPVTAAALGGVSPATANGSAVFVAARQGGVVGRFDSTSKAWSTLPTNLLDKATIINDVQIFTLTNSHADSAWLAGGNSLMLAGHIVLANGTTATAALYDGSGITPFLLSSAAGGATGPGQAFAVVAQNAGSFFATGGRALAVGFIVLIGLALALGVVFLVVAAGMLARIVQRRRAGYRAAPTGREKMAEVVPSAGLGGAAAAAGSGSAMLGEGAGALVSGGSSGDAIEPVEDERARDENIARQNLRRIHPGELFGGLGGARA